MFCVCVSVSVCFLRVCDEIVQWQRISKSDFASEHPTLESVCLPNTFPTDGEDIASSGRRERYVFEECTIIKINLYIG